MCIKNTSLDFERSDDDECIDFYAKIFLDKIWCTKYFWCNSTTNERTFIRLQIHWLF